MSTMTINGAVYTVDHDAISRNSGDGVEYYTAGKDSDGNSVEIVWDTREDWDWQDPANDDNEENACDWDVAKIEIIEEAEIYQIAILNECCSRVQVSALVKKPTAKEIEQRSTEDYDDKEINDILLSESSYDGKMELGGDWGLIEGNLDEIQNKAVSLQDRRSSWARRTGKKVEQAVSEER